jgi:hypothetical protein
MAETERKRSVGLLFYHACFPQLRQRQKTQGRGLCFGLPNDLIDANTQGEMTMTLTFAKAGSTKRMTMFALAVALGCAASTAKAPPKVTGTFSNLTYNNEGGDVLGTEISIVNSNRGYYVVYQISEGEPAVPVVLPAKVAGSSISFVIPPEGDPRGAFAGTIGDQELSGTFAGNKEQIHLKRKASYWQ